MKTPGRQVKGHSGPPAPGIANRQPKAKISKCKSQRARLCDIIASRIRDYIVGRSLGAGDRLPTEHEMARQFGVSRGSVREATQALAFLGIIHSAPKRGITVGQMDMNRVTEYLAFHFALKDYPKEQLLKTRSLIEKGALPGVMKRIAAEPAVYDKFEERIHAMADATDADAFIRCDVAFHRTLLEYSGMDPLVAFGDVLNIFFMRFRKKILEKVEQEEWSVRARSHGAILTALRSGNLAEAERVMDEHLLLYRSPGEEQAEEKPRGGPRGGLTPCFSRLQVEGRTDS